MIGDNQKEQGFVTVATKVSESMARVLNEIARAKGIKVYELMQLVCWFLVRYTSDRHNLNEDINRLMMLFHSEVGWKDLFNLCNPTAENEVAQEILILQQPGKRGFGAVMVDKPFMGHWTQLENSNMIVERIIEVCLPDVYKRIRLLATEMQCESLAEVLITLADAQTIEWLNEQNRREMEGAANMHDYAGAIEYGNKHKRVPHRTPDSLNLQQKIVFDDGDREVADMEAQGWEGEQRGNADDGLIDGVRPFDQEY